MGSISNVMLPPLSALYRAVTQTRLAAYNRGLLAVTKLPAPVISIGNLTTGGTGKTPLVEWVCRTLARKQRRVCILTRGYGRTNAGSRVIVSDGAAVLTNAAEGGDEPFLLAQNLKGFAAVISDQNRIAAGKWAIDNLGAEVFVLDDGFQHLALARDLNILTVDATNPWGGGKLLPAGRLREPRSGLSRADCVVVTRADQSDQLVRLAAEIQSLTGAQPVVTSQMIIKSISRMNSEPPEELGSLLQPVAAFCAVGNPESFFELLRRGGIDPVFTRSFWDHHHYTQTDVDALIQRSKEAGAQSVITTAKDAVKLQLHKFELPCYVVNIEISIEEEDRIIQMVDAAAAV
ncbi:MAG: tetraacyldisaccharide 4'-kinase [Pyrinomonadaceae bacterium]|nr:tetraacyldisaccharide 4'-kinase [Pyrinomonadaceae bacterium]